MCGNLFEKASHKILEATETHLVMTEEDKGKFYKADKCLICESFAKSLKIGIVDFLKKMLILTKEPKKNWEKYVREETNFIKV